MRVAEIMSRDVCIAHPDDSVEIVARIMADRDVGFLPVGDGDRLVGTITDRDIAVRAVARGKGGTATVRDTMTPDVKYCFDDEDVGHVIQNMGDLQLRRLPVVDRNKRLVGVVALADGALKDSPEGAGIALTGIVEPARGISAING
jgi:CBS domain-containing protein